jgi:hypothetical protein
MALQINTQLTTRSGLTVATGSYCWLQTRMATDNEYSVQVDLVFFINKAAFDAVPRKSRFQPAELTDNQVSYRAVFTPTEFAALTQLIIHQFIQAQLVAILGSNTVTLVQ